MVPERASLRKGSSIVGERETLSASCTTHTALEEKEGCALQVQPRLKNRLPHRPLSPSANLTRRLSPLLLLPLLLLLLSPFPRQVSCQEEEEEEEEKPTFRQRLNLHRPLKVQVSKASRYTVPGLNPDQSGCSCYRLKNTYCCWQALCVCHNVCYNGSALLGNFRRIPCVMAEPPLPPSPGQKASPLIPVRCRKTEKFRQMLGIVLRETPFPDALGMRYPKWRTTRRSIEWREGTTYLQPLDKSYINIAHFWGKVAQLLLINNASTAAPGLPYHVDRYMFPREAALFRRMAELGGHGWHANMLRQLVGLAARDRLEGEDIGDVPGMKAKRFAERRALLDGALEFEKAWESASERHPLCFDRVVIPGYLKAITYPSGADEATFFRETVREDLGMNLPPVYSGNSPHARARKPVRVLYIMRNSTSLKGKRTFTPESEEALLALLKTMDFKVTMMDPSRMSFREQFYAVIHNEIIVGLHGAALINAALARNTSVLLEIMPYRVFHQGYYFAAVNAGLTYFLHQARQGTPQRKDEEFESLSFGACINDVDCKEYFFQRRPVELTREDLLDIGALLMQARQFAVEARWNLNWAGRKLKHRFESLCASKQRDIRCRMDLIRSPVADPNVECIVKKDCEGRTLGDAENLDDIM